MKGWRSCYILLFFFAKQCVCLVLESRCTIGHSSLRVGSAFPAGNQARRRESSSSMYAMKSIFNRQIAESSSRISQSSIPIDIGTVFTRRKKGPRVPLFDEAVAIAPAREQSKRLTRLDVSLFIAYFCVVVTNVLSGVMLPSVAAEYTLTTSAATAFVAGVASMAPLGGGGGKIINGFVCQRIGGKLSSMLYMLGAAFLSLALSNTKTGASIGWILAGLEFLASIHWTSSILILDQHYNAKPAMVARGVAILSAASAVGALLAKAGGAALIQLSSWRTMARCGAIVSLIGALSMLFGVTAPGPEGAQPTQLQISNNEATQGNDSKPTVGRVKKQSLGSLTAVLRNPLFWMIGIAHSVGYIVRSDSMISTYISSATMLSGEFVVAFYLLQSTVATDYIT